MNQANHPLPLVAFQGEHGAYSEEAIFKAFDHQVQTVPSHSFQLTLHKLTDQTIDYAVLPIENTLGGTVGAAFDELLKNDLYIHKEIVLKINHCLLGLPDAQLNLITDIYSHPQALAQCDHHINQYQFNAHSNHDTAGSAQYIKERNLMHEGAIASSFAAETYGLKIIKRHFEDESFNYTRFFMLANKPDNEYKPHCSYKTTVIFATQHKPNALVEVLNALSTHKLNMTKIESRPSKNRAWEYYFFVDFIGHQYDTNVKNALHEMASHTVFLKVLGSYRVLHFI